MRLCLNWRSNWSRMGSCGFTKATLDQLASGILVGIVMVAVTLTLAYILKGEK